jgi:hypothetical protein
MSSVTFSTTVGGDGSTVTDDDNATTGLGNGGSLIRLVPMMQQVVNVAETTVAAATSSLGGATTNSTSTTSLSIATGSKSLTLVESGKAYTIGQYVIIASTASPTNYMVGQVTSFSGTSLVVNVTVINGSGTIAAWSISVTAVANYLPLAGGTMTGAITFAAGQFGTNVNTFLSTPSSANLAAALTDETGSGAAVFATSPTLVTPVLGTPSSGTLSSCTVDGTNGVGYKNIPLSGIKTGSYTLVAGDVGKFIELGTSGSVVVPASVFAAGDAISIFNNTSASISCTCSAVTTVYKGGTDADISSFSVTTRGVATILFITATVAVITGNLA